MAYNLRDRPKPDFHAIGDIRLPRATRVRAVRYDQNKLYPVEILERDGERVKLHYVGYSHQYDEWRDASINPGFCLHSQLTSPEDSCKTRWPLAPASSARSPPAAMQPGKSTINSATVVKTTSDTFISIADTVYTAASHKWYHSNLRTRLNPALTYNFSLIT